MAIGRFQWQLSSWPRGCDAPNACEIEIEIDAKTNNFHTRHGDEDGAWTDKLTVGHLDSWTAGKRQLAHSADHGRSDGHRRV